MAALSSGSGGLDRGVLDACMVASIEILIPERLIILTDPRNLALSVIIKTIPIQQVHMATERTHIEVRKFKQKEALGHGLYIKY